MNLSRSRDVQIGLATGLSVLMFSASPAASEPRARGVQAGPIWNQIDAEQKCPDVARRAGGTWTGEWLTTKPGEMSLCDVVDWQNGRTRDRWIDAGPSEIGLMPKEMC